MKCPNCGRPLLQKTAKGVTLDLCPGCRGAWFDTGEMEKLSFAASEFLAAPNRTPVSSASCPRCQVPLRHTKYPGTMVTVDICKKCGGFWLDAGEYEEITAIREHLAGSIPHVKPRPARDEPPPGGVKGALLRFIDAALSALQE